MSQLPIAFEDDYVEPRSRATTFFRLLLVIPHAVVVAVWGFVAFLAVVVAWFALVFTGRWPRGLYDFCATYLRYQTHVYGYLGLLTDRYPPFGASADYPVRIHVGPPKPEYSRWKAGLRLLIGIPVMIIIYAMQIVWEVGAFLAWFAILVLGRQPKGLQDMIALGMSYQQRGNAYLGLLTEEYPPFTSPSPVLEGGRPSSPLPPAPAAPEAPRSGSMSSGDPLNG